MPKSHFRGAAGMTFFGLIGPSCFSSFLLELVEKSQKNKVVVMFTDSVLECAR
jgi:hypothetical protein